MSGRQQLFENGRDKRGNSVPVDLQSVKNAAPWAKYFVRTEAGIFAFSEQKAANTFAGDVATVEQ